MTQEELNEKWLRKLVKPKGYYNIPDKEYFVTSAVLGQDCFLKFAIMATDYSRENKQWITIDISDEKEVGALDDRFEILGDYKNINHEIVFKYYKDETIDDISYKIYNWKNFTNDTEGYYPVPYDSIEGTKDVFDIEFVLTNGKSAREIHYIEEKGKTFEEIYNLPSIAQLRGFVMLGMRQLMNYDV